MCPDCTPAKHSSSSIRADSVCPLVLLGHWQSYLQWVKLRVRVTLMWMDGLLRCYMHHQVLKFKTWAQIECSVIGRNCEIGQDCIISGSYIHDNVKVLHQPMSACCSTSVVLL